MDCLCCSDGQTPSSLHVLSELPQVLSETGAGGKSVAFDQIDKVRHQRQSCLSSSSLLDFKACQGNLW